MNTQRVLLQSAVSAVTMVAASAATSGATIAFAGQTFDNQDVLQWRTAAEAKALDLDGDDVYGTDGYIVFATAVNGPGGFIGQNVSNDSAYTLNGAGLTTISDLPDGIAISDGFLPPNRAVSSNTFYPVFDDPNGGPDIRMGHLTRNLFDDTVDDMNGVVTEFTIGASTPGAGLTGSVLRLGVMLNNDAGPGISDFMRVQTTDSNTGRIENVAGDSGQTMMFFDVTDYAEGDVIQVWPYSRLDDNQSKFAISGLTFDTVIVPEPSAIAGLASLAGLALRRRSR